MSPPRPNFFDPSYAYLWDSLPEALQVDISNQDISANTVINTLGGKYKDFFKSRYVTFVNKMIESNATQADLLGLAGENYRLDNILDTFARDSNDNLNPADFTPITNFLEWNVFDASNSYLGGFADYLQGTSPFKRANLQYDTNEALTNNKSFFAVLVLGQVPIQTILTRYYPDNTYTQFVQSVVYAGTTTSSAIYSNTAIRDGYGSDVSGNVDPTAFNPYQYNFGNLRPDIDTIPQRIRAIDMWAAATPRIDISGNDPSNGASYRVDLSANWDKWLSNVDGFLEFVGLAFQYYDHIDASDAAIIQEFASTDTDGFEKEFVEWVSGGYNNAGVPNVTYPYNLDNLSPSIYTYAPSPNDEVKSYQLIYTNANGSKSFVITAITLLKAGVSIDKILNAFANETAPSMFYKGYAPAQYLRQLCYVQGKLSFSKLIGFGDASGLYDRLNMSLVDLDDTDNDLGFEFVNVTQLDPYILLYAENDFSNNSTNDTIFTYPSPQTTYPYADVTGGLKTDMSMATFKSNGDSITPDQNDIIRLIYDNVYMNKIYSDSSFVNGYSFVTEGNTDGCGNLVTPVSLDRGKKIRLDELRSLVGYEASELAVTLSESDRPFTIDEFAAENYSETNGGPSMSLFDCYSIYGYSLSEIYNAILANKETNYTDASAIHITTALGDLSESRKRGLLQYDMSGSFTDYDLIYYLREENSNVNTDPAKDISNIEKFFPALSYDRIRNTYFVNNSSAFDSSVNHTISIETLTDNGAYLKFLSASDTNGTDKSIRGILSDIDDFSEYTSTDVAYYVLTLPSSPLSILQTTVEDLSGAFSQAPKLNPIDLLVLPDASGSTHVDGSYSVFTKLELNGLYADDGQNDNAPGSELEFSKLGINTFLPASSDYKFLLYGTNTGLDSSDNGIRGILEAITDFSEYNPAQIADLCCALKFSHTIDYLVVPHDIGPNGDINVFTREEIRNLTFGVLPDTLPDNRKYSPSELVQISEWDVSKNSYDYVYDRDYALLNITDEFDHGDDSGNAKIKYILNNINSYDTSNNNSVSHINIAIALNNIYTSDDTETPPLSVDLFDGDYYTRDEIRTLFLTTDASYQLNFSVLTNVFDFDSSAAFYKLAYATDSIDANGFYATDISAINMKQILTAPESNITDDTERAQIIRKMIYSKEYQYKLTVQSKYDVKYLVQPWQLINNFGFDANMVTDLPTIYDFNIYVDVNTSTLTSVDAVQTMLINLYQDPYYYVYYANAIDEFYYNYTLYNLSRDFGYNGDNNDNYLTRIIGESLFLPLNLSPRRLAIELRLGAYNDSSYSNTDGYYSFSDVYDALNGDGGYDFDFTDADFETDPSEARNKAIYVTDYSPESSYIKKNGDTATDENNALYRENGQVTMWSNQEWVDKFFDKYTGRELFEYYKFTYNEIRGYFFDISNQYFNPNGTYTFSVGKFLTYGTFMTNLLFTRDVVPNTTTPVTISLLQQLDASYSDLSDAINYIASESTDTIGNAKSTVSDASQSIMQYLYYNLTEETQIYGIDGSNAATTIKDVEFALMGDISSNTVAYDIQPLYRVDMANAFSINAMYDEVISTVDRNMKVNDFYHYYNRVNLHDYVVGIYELNGVPLENHPSINDVTISVFGNRVDSSNITIDYFTLSELAVDDTIPLSKVADEYLGTNSIDRSRYPDNGGYPANTDKPYLYGKIATFNTRKSTGYELWYAGYEDENNIDNWSALNIRKLYYDISGDSSYIPANRDASMQYISFKNLVGAVHSLFDLSNGESVNPSKGDYSLVYAQDYDLRTDMSNTLTDLSAIQLLYEGSPEYNDSNNTNSHSEEKLGYVYKTNGNEIDKNLDGNSNLYYDEIRTIVGFAGTRIKNVYNAETIVREADIETSQIFTTATNNYWVSGTPYDTKWMTLKYAYEFTGTEIAQNSETVTGKDLLNVPGNYDTSNDEIYPGVNVTKQNDGFNASQVRIGFFHEYYYYENSNRDSSANNSTDNAAGFSRYLVDPEFIGPVNDIQKFAQMVNNGEFSSMNAKDGSGNYLITPYSTSELDDSNNANTDNVAFYNLFKYLLALYKSLDSDNTSDLYNYINNTDSKYNFLSDLNTVNSGNTDIKLGNISSNLLGQDDEIRNRIKIAMFIKFRLENYVNDNDFHNRNFVKNFFYSYLKTTPISIIYDYHNNTDIQTFKILYLQNLFSSADLFRIQTIPAIWNNRMGSTVKDIVEFYESEKNIDNSKKYTDSDIFSILYPYIPLEYLLAYRTYHMDSSGVITNSGQEDSETKSIYYYPNPLDPSNNYLPGSRWISVKTALQGMDGKWGVQWNSDGGYYNDKNSDAPSIDQVLAALSVIDSNSDSDFYGIDPENDIVSYSYSGLTSDSPVIVEIRDAFSLTDGSHPAICGYTNNTYPLIDPSDNMPGDATPTINQLVALLDGQNIPLGFAKLIFVPTIIIRASIYTRAEKRGLFAPNDIVTATHSPANDGGLADAYYQLSKIADLSSNYTYPTDTNTIEYYTNNTLVEDLISLKFPIDAYNDFLFNTSIPGANSSATLDNNTIPSPGLSENPFTTYGLLTAYDTNILGYDNDGFAINVTGQLIWHTVAERNDIIEMFEPDDASEYKYNPAGDNSGNIEVGLYVKDNKNNYFYAYPENILSIRDAYRIELRNNYKASTKLGIGMSNDPNLNILIALKAIGIPPTIDLKFPVTAYSPFTNRNIGGDLSGNVYSYIRGTNTQSSRSSKDYFLGADRKLINFTAYDLLSAVETNQIDSDENGFVFTSQDRLLWNTLSERDEIIEAFSNTTNNLLKYDPTTVTYVKDMSGHYYFSYPSNLNDFGDLAGTRSTP